MRDEKIEAVIFDWAGTTVDYGCFAPVQAFIEAFKCYGIEPTVEEVRKPMGMLKLDHVRTMMQMPRLREEWNKKQGRDWREEDVFAVYKKSEDGIMDILSDFVDIKPHVVETIQELKGQGIKIGSTTGYTDEMMSVVVPAAAAAGYEPDTWVSPNSVGDIGRPFPYMIFENMKRLNISSVNRVVKVGDTVSDIKEGKNAGVYSVGIIEGSSIMGCSKEEFDAMSEAEKETARKHVAAVYQDAGADDVINDMSDLRRVLL